ncbi:MAG: hypothetical protein GEU88_00680 [Solirubrobacterales bacterium]|nr:hypothetical protein [Solirubrobacterales bacterium]
MADHRLRCPKCGGEMPSRVRNGVQIEQCLECHGIFLDRGEFERLITTESSFLGEPSDRSDDDEDGAPRQRSRDFAFLG